MPVGALKDNVAGRSFTPGTTEFVVEIPDDYHDPFSVLTDGATYAYKAVRLDGEPGYETGTGPWSIAGSTITRTPKTSSNGGSAVDFGGVELVIYIVVDSEMLMSLAADRNVDGGAASSVYLPSQRVDGGSASG